MKIKKIIVFMILISILLCNNVLIDAKTNLNKNVIKQSDSKEYIIKGKNNKNMKELKERYRSKICINHTISDEKYLNDENITTLKLTGDEKASVRDSSDYIVEENYTVSGLKSDFKDELKEVPCTLEEYYNRNDYEYSDNPSEFIPYEADFSNGFNNEILPWNIEIVAGDPRTNEFSGSGIKVAIIDSGIDVHNDLKTREWIDFSDKVYGYKPIDNSGHGTEMAGIIAARNNGIGTIGIAYNAEIYSVKILDSGNKASISSVIKAIEWCIKNDIDVINMSFGLHQDSKLLHEYIKKAAENNITIVAAAGNNGRVQYPAKYDEVISVGGINKDLNIASYSPKDRYVDVFAPSEMAQTTGYVGTYTKSNGTSIAAAHVTGIVATLKSKNSSLTFREVKEIISKSALKINMEDNAAGLVNYQNAVNMCDEIGDNRVEVTEDKDNYVDFENVKHCANNDNYVEGSWSMDKWQGVIRTEGTGHYTMINAMDTEYFAMGAANYTDKIHNRWIVADAAYLTDSPAFKSWENNDTGGVYNYPPYHANVHYSIWQVGQAVNFMYELTRNSLILGNQFDFNINNYGNTNEYRGIAVHATMKKRIIYDLNIMYANLVDHYGYTLNMGLASSRGYMVLGMLLHRVEDMYCHKAKITYNMLCSSEDGSIGQSDVFGSTFNDSSIWCGIFDYDWSKYWECREIIIKHNGMPMNILKFRMQDKNYNIICNGNSYLVSRNQAYEDNPYFYSNRYAVSVYMTESVLRDMKNAVGSTSLYGFDSWGVSIFSEAVPKKYVSKGVW